MLHEDAIRFLKETPPFSFLPEQELGTIASDLRLNYFPRGTKILTQNGPASKYLGLIKKGAVKVCMTAEDGKEVVIDYRNEGEPFGLLSLVSGDRSRTDVVAVEDTICYFVPKEKILALLQDHRAVNEYFLKSFFLSFIEKTYEETRKRYQEPGNNHLSFTMPVGHVVRKSPVTAPPESSIQEAARIMVRNRVSSIIVVDADGQPAGIITDRDLRERVVAEGAPITGPVTAIMTQPIHTAQVQDSCFEILLKMMHHRIHHILIMDGDRLHGMATNHDLMVLQGTSPAVLAKELERVENAADFPAVVAKLRKSVATLLREGAAAVEVTALISDFIDRLIHRARYLTERQIGPAPVSYTLFIAGDGGGRELALDFQLLLGVIIAQPPTEPAPAVVDYFHSLAARLNETLSSCGINRGAACLLPSHIKTIEEWQRATRSWPKDDSNAGAFPDLLDARPLRGDGELLLSLKRSWGAFLRSSPAAARAVVAGVVANRPPVGFFRHEVMNEGGSRSQDLDLYHRGLRPIVEALRLLATFQKIDLESTGERLSRLAKQQTLPEANEIEQAHNFLLTLLLHNQVVQVEVGSPVNTIIKPAALSSLERKTLKQIFQLTARLHGFLARVTEREAELAAP